MDLLSQKMGSVGDICFLRQNNTYFLDHEIKPCLLS